MLVKDWMSKRVITIDVDDSMDHAMKFLRENNIRMMPVVQKGRLAGIVTDRNELASTPYIKDIRFNGLPDPLWNFRNKSVYGDSICP